MIDKDNYYDRISTMKILKLLVLIFIVVFMLSSTDSCSGTGAADDGTHCLVCCSTGCHTVALCPSNNITLSLPSLASYISLNTVLHQELILRGIDYPPKTIF